MGKVVRILTIVAAIAVNVIPGVGQVLSAAMIASITAAGAAAALGIISNAVLGGPKVPRSQLSRLQVTMETGAPRKAALGTTAFPLDLRYHEGTGTDQEFIHYIIAHAAHRVKSIDEIWFEQDLAWSAAGGVTAKYSGYLTVTTRLEGAAGNEVSISGNWGSGERLTGCAYTYLRIKRTGNSRRSESPLASGLPGRVTVIGEGAPLYDPRLDSTVPGGSGAHRAADQSTWGIGYSPADSYDNPALQLLWWLLGWKINGKLSIGCGVPVSRIDLASFIEAANFCDENVALLGGGTQPRYRSSGTASDSDDRMEIINGFLAAMNGTLRDNTGRLSVNILKNDLAEFVLDLNDGDMLEAFEWNQTGSLSQTFNVVRGRYVDPSQNSLYQLVDYPEVSGPSPDGIERVLSLDLPYVEDPIRAQRIAKQVLKRSQYRGEFSGTFSAKALGCDVGEIVRLSLESLGISNKLFRVTSKQINTDGRIPLTLLEEDASIYAWSAEEASIITPTAPVTYDPLNSPFILADTFAQETAEAAATAASDAATDADAANAAIAAITSDNILSADEKPDVRLRRDAIIDEYPIIGDRADALAVSTTAYDAAYNDLIAYLSGLALSSATNTAIDRTIFNAEFTDYYQQRQIVLDGIADEASVRASGLPLGNSNLVPFSRMEGDRGWGVNFNPASLSATNSYGTTSGLRFFRASATASASGQAFSIGHDVTGTLRFVLTAGGRVSVQARLETTGTANGPWRLALFGFTAGGSQSEIASAGGSGLRALTDAMVQMFVTIPAGIVGGRLEFYSETTGAGAFTVAIAEPMATAAALTQVAHPPFAPGPNSDDGADVTSASQITTSQPAPFQVQADSSGVTTTDLATQTRSIMVYRGGVLQTAGVTAGTAAPTTGITVSSVNISGGVVTVTLATATATGSVAIPVIFNGVTYNVTIPVNRTLAAPVAGGSGSQPFTDQTWTNINSTTYTQVTDTGATVLSTSGGQLAFSYSAQYEGGNAQCKAQYSLDGTTWSDVTSSEVTGTPPITIPGEEQPGEISLAQVTQSSLTASTLYYVRAVARRTAGSTNLSWLSPAFTAKQP